MGKYANELITKKCHGELAEPQSITKLANYPINQSTILQV